MKLNINEILIKSSVSNYILIILKIVASLFLIRIIFLGISNEEYGFWALLWSIFGYSVLLDFGFGTAVQKATSEALEKNEWEDYNKLISTIFFSYVILSLGIFIFTLIMAINLEKIFVFSSNESINYYKIIFMIFGFGTTLIFPFGFFKEILRGLREIPLRNNIDMIFIILNFIIIYLCVSVYSSLMLMAVGAIIVQLLANIFMTIYVYKKIPSLKISITLFQKDKVKEVMSFSFFAYIVMFSNLIIFKTDQIVISIFSTVTLVGFYQIISRISELFRQFSTQIHDIIGPISAALFTSSNNDKLSKVLLQSNQIVSFISTMLIVPSFLFIEDLLFIWLQINNSDVILTAKILLVSMYILVTLRSSTVQVLLMCNKHKQLTAVAIIEAFMNLFLSIYLIQFYSIIGVAIGTLIPNIVLAIVYNIPISCKFSGISIFEYLKQAICKNIFTGLIVYGILFYLSQFFGKVSFIGLILYGIMSILLYCFVYYICCLNKKSKKKVKNVIKEYFLTKKKLLNIINV